MEVCMLDRQRQTRASVGTRPGQRCLSRVPCVCGTGWWGCPRVRECVHTTWLMRLFRQDVRYGIGYRGNIVITRDPTSYIIPTRRHVHRPLREGVRCATPIGGSASNRFVVPAGSALPVRPSHGGRSHGRSYTSPMDPLSPPHFARFPLLELLSPAEMCGRRVGRVGCVVDGPRWLARASAKCTHNLV